MKKTLLGMLLCGLCFLAGAGSLAAQSKDPQVFVQEGVDEALAVAYAPGAVGALPERIRPVLEKFFAFDGITRRAVGPGWREFKPEEQRRATELFTLLVIRTYSERFDPAVKPNLTFGRANDLERGRKEIASKVEYAGKSYNVAYRLEPSGASWRVYDVIVEGVSLISNYRAQFDALFNKGGAAEVIKSLEANLKAGAPTP